jgi:hypothetical protein
MIRSVVVPRISTCSCFFAHWYVEMAADIEYVCSGAVELFLYIYLIRHMGFRSGMKRPMKVLTETAQYVNAWGVGYKFFRIIYRLLFCITSISLRTKTGFRLPYVFLGPKDAQEKVNIFFSCLSRNSVALLKPLKRPRMPSSPPSPSLYSLSLACRSGKIAWKDLCSPPSDFLANVLCRKQNKHMQRGITSATLLSSSCFLEKLTAWIMMFETWVQHSHVRKFYIPVR